MWSQNLSNIRLSGNQEMWELFSSLPVCFWRNQFASLGLRNSLAQWPYFTQKETKSPVCIHKDPLYSMSSPSSVCSKALLVNIVQPLISTW